MRVMSTNTPDGALRSKRMHHKAKYKSDRLFRRDGYCCHWCGRLVIRVADIAPWRIMAKPSRWVQFVSDSGDVLRAWVASVDHVKPLRDGGDNRFDNLVTACRDCNNRRTTHKRQPKLVCRKCGVSKPDSDSTLCDECRAFHEALHAHKRRQPRPTGDGE